MVPCLEVKSVPDATYAWALAETEEDESPKNLDQTERLVVNPRGKGSLSICGSWFEKGSGRSLIHLVNVMLQPVEATWRMTKVFNQ